MWKDLQLGKCRAFEKDGIFLKRERLALIFIFERHRLIIRNHVCSSGCGELVLKGSLFKAEIEENQADHTNSSGLTQKCEVLWNGKCVLIMSLILT